MKNPASAQSQTGGQGRFLAGAAEVDLTPAKPLFLHGYPHVPRTSTGVLDPLLASALYLSDGRTDALWIGCDLIGVPKACGRQAKQRIAAETGIPAERVAISATHTHSGPVMERMISNAADPIVPPPDEDYRRQVVDAIVQAGTQARAAARPAEVKFAVADGSGLGTNRHDPAGPALPQIPVLWCHDADSGDPLAVMAICTMHPTVLHEDSTLISGDFPGQGRRYLKEHVIGEACPFVYHMGAAGNQSPRHVVHANTPAEAQRQGQVLGKAIAATAAQAERIERVALTVRRAEVDLPVRALPAVEEAAAVLERTRERYESLRRDGAPRATVRTAECDVFGAEETLTLARAAADGTLAEAARTCMPAEVQVICVGPHAFVGWPGEVFVEFALQVRNQFPQAWVSTLTNGGLQGYLVTQEAVDERMYEAGNAVFASPVSPQKLVDATVQLLKG